MLAKYLKNANEFDIKFIKRSDGTVRTMKAQRPDGEFITGAGPKYDASSKALVTVIDKDILEQGIKDGLERQEAGRRSFRAIPMELILEITVDGVTHKLADPVVRTYTFKWGKNFEHQVTALTEEAAIAKLKLDCGLARKPRDLQVTYE